MSKQPSIARSQKPCYDGTCRDRGEVTERLKVLASKASVRETVPWVRIPPSPPFSLHNSILYVLKRCLERLFAQIRVALN
jgi:hypothetical protein